MKKLFVAAIMAIVSLGANAQQEEGTFSSEKSKNSVFQITLGYKF